MVVWWQQLWHHHWGEYALGGGCPRFGTDELNLDWVRGVRFSGGGGEALTLHTGNYRAARSVAVLDTRSALSRELLEQSDGDAMASLALAPRCYSRFTYFLALNRV